jgi:hypothetical protein
MATVKLLKSKQIVTIYRFVMVDLIFNYLFILIGMYQMYFLMTLSHISMHVYNIHCSNSPSPLSVPNLE